MTDPQAILSALQAIKVASDIAKGLRAADQSLAQAELKLKIAGLMEALADARASVVDAQEEIRALQQQVKELQATEDIRTQVVRRDNVYYVNKNGVEAGPYCPRCFEVDSRRMPLTEFPLGVRDFGRYQCPECEKMF